MPLDRLVGPAVVVDVSLGPKPTPITGWTAGARGVGAEHGPIPDGTIVLVRTGWSSRWPDKARYLGTTKTGPEAVAELHFPGIDSSAARWLRRAAGEGGRDRHAQHRLRAVHNFRTHRILLAENIPAFENVANLDRLPATGAFVVALPMKIKGGSGGPLRIVAVVPSASP